MTTVMTFPNHPTNAKLPSRECIRSHSTLVVSFMSCSHHPAASPFLNKLYSQYLYVAEPYWDNNFRRVAWKISSSGDNSGLDPSPSGSSSGGTRLVRAIQAFQTKIVARIKELRTNLPIKLLFLLVGFYCATAFATVIGQTGDWDILSAALAVAVVEGIGALMYRASFPLLNNMRSLITMFNYWKDIEEVINLISYMQIILQMCDPGAPLGDYIKRVTFWFIGFDTIFFEVWVHVLKMIGFV